MNKRHEKLGFNSAWSMAVGGMVGGGIFSTLGIVIGIAGELGSGIVESTNVIE